MLFKNIGLYDNFLVYIIPSLFNFYNMIIFMTYFKELNPGLEESSPLIKMIIPRMKNLLKVI